MKEKIKNTNIENKDRYFLKIKNKNIINIIKLIIVILFIIFLAVFINNKNLIYNNFRKEIKQENEQERPLLSFIAYDNQNEQNIKGMIIINSTSTIDYVEFLDGTIVYGNGKNKLAKDVELVKDQEYSVKIISGDTENIEKIIVDDSYLEKMINFIELEIAEGENKKIQLLDTRGIAGMTTYYKIGKNSTNWAVYNGTIILADYCIDIEDYANKNYVSTICTKTVDRAGNCLYIDKTFDIDKKGELDLLKNAQVSGTLASYGFTQSLYRVPDKSGYTYFDSSKGFGVGHADQTASYSGTLKLDWTKLKRIKAKELYLGVWEWSQSGSWVETTITVSYTDGTSKTEKIEKMSNGSKMYYPVISLQQDKEISNIQFYILRI